MKCRISKPNSIGFPKKIGIFIPRGVQKREKLTRPTLNDRMPITPSIKVKVKKKYS